MLELAASHRRGGRLGPAEAVAKDYLRQNPCDADAHHLLGTILFEGSRAGQAVAQFRAAIVLSPAQTFLYRDLAVALRSLQNLDRALDACRRALSLDPQAAASFLVLGHLAAQRGARLEAMNAFRKGMILNPGDASTLMDLANTLQLQGAFEQAERLYRATIHINPRSAEAHKNMAVALCERGSLDEAEAAIRRAVRFQPDEAGWRMALGQILLLRGRYEEGWKHYEWRWRAGTMRQQARSFSQPEWAGEDLQGKVLLLHAEQGLGDTVQFCRYASLAAQKATVVLEVQRPLVGLLTCLPGVSQVVAAGDPLPPFNRHSPLLSLPRICRTTLETIPDSRPYLRAYPARIIYWRQRLATVVGLKVGLVWAGGTVTPRNPQRSIAPEKLAPLAGLPGITFVSLQKYQQKGDHPQPPDALNLLDWTDELTDFSDTAALIMALDLVIAVDTAVAHLAAALGKPTWLLNRFFPCWRWLSSGAGSAWYPTLRQFRQTRLDDWETVIATVRNRLATSDRSVLPHLDDGNPDRFFPTH